jgi:ADP-dependent NAD(P)H-hydrate dehydratase / NAD(P)H-hydrate epimerase
MEPVLTPQAMGAADRRTIAAGTPVDVLMERAGRAVAWRVRQVVGGGYGRRAVVVCGKGNNGGDGLITARTLAGWGMRVRVCELADGINRAAFDREGFDRALSTADVVVDAMYGTGFRGRLDGDAAWVVARLDEWTGPTVAVDIPSGVDGLTGGCYGPAVHAHSTVTFAARKPGLVFQPGRSHAGIVTVADIGIDLGSDGGLDAGDDDGGYDVPLGLTGAADVRAWLPERAPDAHKWQSGVMVVGGSAGMTGAPMFVSHAAMRAGAGIVWCGLPGSAAAHAASGTEVITRPLPATPDGLLAAAAVESVLAAINRFRAFALGPGLGADPAIRPAVCALVAEARVPLVLDADGLNALEGDLAPLRARVTLGAPAVLTPHEGEYARLMGEPVGGDRIAAARALAERSGAIVLLKGPGTVIAAPSAAGSGTGNGGGALVALNPTAGVERAHDSGGGGLVALNPTGGAELATAGSGDVLTGIIAGFLARGMAPFHAAAAAAWVHGQAADRLLVTGGPGLVAGDLIRAIPPTLSALPRAVASTRTPS